MRKNVNNQVMGTVKWGLPFCLFTFLPLSMMAQDDLYFVPTKKAKVEVVTDNYGLPKDTYYEGSDRSVDEYNRRLKSTYTEIEGDSTKVDIIDFNGQKGVYPDSVKNGDFELTEKLRRFDGYDLTDKAAFWAGYQKGRYDWGWHSPWYYSTYGWYPGWCDPWYDYVWYGGWYGPWYRHWYGWYDPWYSPWYYRSWYGLYDPWYYGYYGWYGGWYGGWYDPWFYGYGWGYPYYWNGWAHSYIGVGRNYASTHIGMGTIRNDGATHRAYYKDGRWSVENNSSRMNSIRQRADRQGDGRNYSSGNNKRSRSGNFSGYRGNSNNNNNNNNNSSRTSNSSFSGTRSSSSSSGSFSGGGGGGSRSGGGGGGRSGGRR